jgi:hypothetical protein
VDGVLRSMVFITEAELRLGRYPENVIDERGSVDGEEELERTRVALHPPR